GGGVALGEVHPATMESRRHPGLFLCGEVLDAFGPIGGYNFMWAWATGRAAGIGDRKSTRLNSSHVKISYAVFCLKKKTSDATSPASAPSSSKTTSTASRRSTGPPCP